MKAAIFFILVATASGQPGDWTQPVEIRHDDNVCISYQARLDGPLLVVRARLEPGWHTFAMDNKQRADEKLAGKPALSADRPTEITVIGGLETVAPWYQTPPQDFSRPALRWFSWGFEREALFVTKIRKSGSAPPKLTVRGQGCTETVCKNIDVVISLPLDNHAGPPEIDLKNLVPVRPAQP
jgi:hypothetical protein